MDSVRRDEVARIRWELDHPVIDGDGHPIGFTPLVRDDRVEVAGEEVATRLAVRIGWAYPDAPPLAHAPPCTTFFA